MSRRTHIHEFRLQRDGAPTLVYRHRIKAKVCGSHPADTPSFCWCEPECYLLTDRTGPGERVYEVIHQNKSRDGVERECLHG